MHGLLRCNTNTGVHAERRADESLRDVKIARNEKRGYRVQMTSHTGSARKIFGIWRKSVELRTRLRTGRVDFRGTERPDEFARYGRRTSWVGVDGKVIRERLCISLPYVETFNSKVIKGFVSELRSRYVFFVFLGFLFSMYICYEHSVYISHIHVWGCDNSINIFRLHIFVLILSSLRMDFIISG